MRDKNLLRILAGGAVVTAAIVTSLTWSHDPPNAPSRVSKAAAAEVPTGDPDDPLAIAPAAGASDAGTTSDTSTVANAVTTKVYDVAALVHPSSKYLGVILDGVPASLAPVTAFGGVTGKQPDMVEFPVRFGDRFDARAVRSVYDAGALPVIRWEPTGTAMSAIAGGASDAAVIDYAKRIRALDLPVAINFAPAMNGNWYTWGTPKTAATDFVAAWRHVHDLFAANGAGNVIWLWAPHAVDTSTAVPLAPLYPGDAYVDWVGIGGSFTAAGKHTYGGVFGPTATQIAAFSRKPTLIVETGAAASPAEPAEIKELWRAVAGYRGVIGLVWSERGETAGHGIAADPSALAEFKMMATDPTFGFVVK